MPGSCGTAGCSTPRICAPRSKASARCFLPISKFATCWSTAIAPISLTILLFNESARLRRNRVSIFWFAYLAGTLAAYALFPYFPSDPPRTVFAGADLPHIVTIFRRFNLAILGKYGIHSSVFPSAHVSAAFACAWGLLIAMPDRRRYGMDRRHLRVLGRDRDHLRPLPFRRRRAGRFRHQLPAPSAATLSPCGLSPASCILTLI